MRRDQKALALVTTDIKTLPARTRVLRVFFKTIALILMVVVVYRLIVPYLFDLHTDLGFIGAVAVALLGLAALIWFAFDFTQSVRRRRRS
jgi:hypothetical protein